MSSGTSTPRGDRSPLPDGGGQQPAAGPAPLTIGKRFVKQYYQSLMTSPDNLPKLYRPTSVLSDGDGSTPADAVSFESASGSADKLTDRFMVKDLQIRFEFEHGAIDAQQSVNGGIILVVTGHVVYYPSVNEDEDSAVDDPIRKGFVHTFFLGAHSVGARVSYYVHNDILRFLKNTSEVSAGVAESKPTRAAPAPSAKEATPAPAEPVPETITPAPETQQPPPEPVSAPVEPPKKEEKSIAPPDPAEESKDDAPGGGVEESKEEAPAAPAPAPAPASKPPKEDKPNKKGNKGSSNAKKEHATAEKESAPPSKSTKNSTRTNKPQAAKELSPDAGRKSPVPLPSPAPKPPPGSWASLVAGAGGSTPASSVAAKPAPPASTKPPPKPTPASEKPTTQPSNDKKVQSSGGPTPNTGNNNNNNNSNNNRDNSNNHKMGNNMRPPKRDPDCTLVIKNLAENTKENDVMALFEPFAVECKARVVGITVAAHRGIAFVDYDSINPVMKAVSKHKEEPMQLFGKVLEVDQKTAEQLARKQRAANQRGGGGGGGNYRSGSPNHNNGGINRYDSRGGGRGGHRRRDVGGRGGDHGGGRGDHGGGRGDHGGGRGDRGGGGMGGRGDRMGDRGGRGGR